MENMFDKVVDSTKYIKENTSYNPKVAVILGSGLGDLVEVIENKEYISYSDIPNFPEATVLGHGNRLVLGTINGIDVVAMQGRFHLYEGYTMKEVTYPVYVMQQLGIEKLIVTNACGGINTDFEPGNLMIINDFINFQGTNPLIGKNDERFGPRFPDMSEPYKLELIEKAKEAAKEVNVDYKEGVYASFTGPYYESAAEIRMIGKLGADAVGMSTVPETIVANYLGIDVIGIACITNMATGIQKMKHSHDRVVATANKASKDLCSWVAKLIEKM